MNPLLLLLRHRVRSPLRTFEQRQMPGRRPILLVTKCSVGELSGCRRGRDLACPHLVVRGPERARQEPAPTSQRLKDLRPLAATRAPDHLVRGIVVEDLVEGAFDWPATWVSRLSAIQ